MFNCRREDGRVRVGEMLVFWLCKINGRALQDGQKCRRGVKNLLIFQCTAEMLVIVYSGKEAGVYHGKKVFLFMQWAVRSGK